MKEKMYIQEDYNITDILNHIGIDSIDQAEAICGRAIYALELDYYDGDLGNVKAVHNYAPVSVHNTTQLTETSSSRLLPDILESVIYLRAGSSAVC